MDRPDWQQRALCRGTMSNGTNFWFAEKSPIGHGIAKQVCKRCPVQQECYDSGKREPIGVWGGETVSIHPARRR